MSLVTAYGATNTGGQNFDVKFSIPINCEYGTSVSNNVNYITVQLKRGHTVPSPTLQNCSIILSGINAELQVFFVQIESGVSQTKPKVIVENC